MLGLWRRGRFSAVGLGLGLGLLVGLAPVAVVGQTRDGGATVETESSGQLSSPGAGDVRPAGASLESRAMAALLSGDGGAWEALVSQSPDQAEALRYARGAGMARRLGGAGRSDSAVRDSYLAYMEERAGQTEGWWRTQYLLGLAADAPYRIRVLDRENRFNKFSRIFNRAVSSVTRLAFLQPGEAVSLVIDAAKGSLANREATVRERLMAAEARRFLELYPTGTDADDMRGLLADLEERLERDRAVWYRERGVEMAERGALDLAREYLRLAPSGMATTGALDKLEELELAQDQGRLHLVAASGGDLDRSAAYHDAVAYLARRVSLGSDPGAGPTAENAAAGAAAREYARAAVLARRGDLEGAIDGLEALADSYPKSPEAPAAEVSLATPGWNLAAGWEQARNDWEQRRKRYMVTGGRSAQDTAMSGASAVAQAGVGAGALFGSDFLFRSVAEGFRSRVESDRAQDAAALYLRRLPQGRLANDLKRARVDLEKVGGNADSALALLGDPASAPASSPREVERLRERQARDQLVMALNQTDLPARRAALSAIVERLGDTPSGKKAAGHLEKLPGAGTAAATGMVIPRDILKSQPEAAAEFGVPAEWVDGRRLNGELTAEGVVVAADGKSASMRISTREGWRTQPLDGRGAQRRLALARQLSLSAASQQEAQSRLSRRRLPLGVEAGAGGGGVDVSPRLLPYEERPGTERLYGR